MSESTVSEDAAAVRPGTAGIGPRQLSIGLILAILLVAANLRAGITSAGPLLSAIVADTGLSATAVSLLTTLPLLAFAATSPFIPAWSRRRGPHRLLALGLVALLVGTLLRLIPSTWALYAGTALLAVGIAIGNVLLPPILKAAVPPRHVSAVTSAYVIVMGLFAGVASGTAVPLALAAAEAGANGWRTTLGLWALPATAALVGWLLYLRRTRKTSPAAARVPTVSGAVQASVSPWRSALAWQVAGFMGLQSLGFYTIVAWLPSILADHGSSAAAGGWQLFLIQVVALGANALVPVLVARLSDQRALAVGATAISMVGYAGIMLAPELATVWSIAIAIGSGGSIVLALSFQAHRAATTAQAAALSGMAQAVGYLVAACGPLLIGFLHDLTGAWTIPLLALITLAVVQAGFGYGAGRDRHY